MFAEVYKKDALQDEEYAECYVFDKTVLLSKTDLESYSCDYDENIIRNFHQKQSSYAQSEGYHSYVSSNDSAIIAPFTDRTPLENDIIVSADEATFLSKDSGGECRSIDAIKSRNPYNSCGSKNTNFDRCNSQHIAHSARVQTPQRHYSESVPYLGPTPSAGAAKAYYQQCSSSSERVNQKHNTAISSQLRKLYPVHTYCIQPNSCQTVAANFSKAGELNACTAKLPGCSKKSYAESECASSTEQSEFVGTRTAPDYTFLDPSKKRIVSNQNLKVIQKQALISYYERHHSTWRSEPQLSTSTSSMVSSQSRPRMPSPTSCHSMCSAPSEDCGDIDKTNSTPVPPYINNLAFDNSTNVLNQITDGCYINNRWKSSTKSLHQCVPSQIGIPFDEERVPELPPKKNAPNLQMNARRLSSPDLPPPSPPPLSDDETYIPDEPFPPPPTTACEEVATFICDTSNPPDEPKIAPYKEPAIKSPPRSDSRLRSRTRTNSMYESKSSKYVNATRSISHDPEHNADHVTMQKPAFGGCSTNTFKGDEIQTSCAPSVTSRKYGNVARFSSSSFRTCKRTPSSESMTACIEKFNSRTSQLASPATLCDTVHRSKLPPPPPPIKLEPSPNSTNNIEQKVKAIRTLFEDKFKKSNFQFPSFSFIHSEKFPSKLDPRFPRTSYQLSQSSNHREFRDCEKGEIFNAVGIYKRTTSPMRNTNDLDNVKSCHVITDSNLLAPQMQPTPYIKAASIAETSPPTANVPPLISSNEETPPCYCAFPSMTDIPIAKLVTTPSSQATLVSTATSPLSDDQRIPSTCAILPMQASGEVDIPLTNHPAIQSSLQNVTDIGTLTIDFTSTNAPQLQPRSQSISPREDLPKNLSSSTPLEDASLRLHEASHLDEGIDDGNDEFVETTTCIVNPRRSVMVPVASVTSTAADSKNTAITMDVASQTDVNIIPAVNVRFKPPPPPPMPVAPPASISYRDLLPQIFEDEIEKLRLEVMSYLMPSNRLYKILAIPKSNVKTPTDYLVNIFESEVALSAPAMHRSHSCVRQSQDTRLQEGSIAHAECVFLSQELNTKLTVSENCDNFHSVPRCASNSVANITATSTTSALYEKKNNLIKYLTRKLEMLKSELENMSQESRNNEELGMTVWQHIMQSLSPREASKYKLHFQEIGQITSLLIGLGARLAKVENSLHDPTQQACQTEKKTLETKRTQLIQQLEDAKELKNDIDRRGASLTSLLRKYFNQQQLNQYHEFIKTKCQLLIYNRNITDKIFNIEQQLNALKEDQIQPYANAAFP